MRLIATGLMSVDRANAAAMGLIHGTVLPGAPSAARAVSRALLGEAVR